MGRSHIVNLANFQQFSAINVLSDPGAVGGPVIVPQCAQITVQFALESGKLGHMVWYGRYSGSFAGTVTQATNILNALNLSTQYDALAAFFATTTILQSVSIRDVNTPNNALITSSLSSKAGTSASPSLPNEVALVVTLRTASAGRQNRGRSFVPGWATNALGAGNVAAGGAVTALQNWADTWSSSLSTNGYTYVLGQKKRQAYTGSTGTSHPARDATSTPITSTPVRDNHWDTIRRRGLK